MERKKRKQEKVFRGDRHLFHYIREGYSVRQVAAQSGKPEHRVRKDIQFRLDSSEIDCIDEIFGDVHHIMIDGYWLPQTREITGKNVSGRTVKRILLLYYDYIHHKVIWFSIRDGEKKAYIEEDLRFLKYHMGYDAIISCTCDGGFGIISALKEVYPNIVIQRCLVHIQRQVRAYISKRPKSDAGKDLARLMRKDILFSSVRFIEGWKLWKEKHSSFLDEKTKGEDNRWRYTHTRLRKAVRHIENALPYMFPSEEHIQKEMTSKEIAQTSNRIEGYFGVLTNEGINEHKGLSPERLMKFISLWIYLHNRK